MPISQQLAKREETSQDPCPTGKNRLGSQTLYILKEHGCSQVGWADSQAALRDTCEAGVE